MVKYRVCNSRAAGLSWTNAPITDQLRAKSRPGPGLSPRGTHVMWPLWLVQSKSDHTEWAETRQEPKLIPDQIQRPQRLWTLCLCELTPAGINMMRIHTHMYCMSEYRHRWGRSYKGVMGRLTGATRGVRSSETQTGCVTVVFPLSCCFLLFFTGSNFSAALNHEGHVYMYVNVCNYLQSAL